MCSLLNSTARMRCCKCTTCTLNISCKGTKTINSHSFEYSLVEVEWENYIRHFQRVGVYNLISTSCLDFYRIRMNYYIHFQDIYAKLMC